MTLQYRPVKMQHPSARWIYRIIGEAFDESGSLLQCAVIPDISPNYSFVSSIAEKCTAGQLALEHLLDVVYDSLP